MRITQKWLKEHEVCDDGFRWFKKHFKRGTGISTVIKKLSRRHPDWVEWLAFEAKWTGVVKGTDPNGHIEAHFRDGELDRDDGPAYIETYSDGTRVGHYYRNGERVEWTGVVKGTDQRGYPYEYHFVSSLPPMRGRSLDDVTQVAVSCDQCLDSRRRLCLTSADPVCRHRPRGADHRR